MNQTDYEELVLLIAYDLEALADAARPYRGISAKERVALVQWLKLEFRRLARHDGDKHGCCVQMEVSHRIVFVPPAPVSYADIPPAVVPPQNGCLMHAPGVPAIYVGTAARTARYMEVR